MSYNLLLDSGFKNNFWKFNNCEYKNGCLTSTEKVFGIEQELILPDIAKLYFRINYLTMNKEIFNVKIGIQNNDVLNVNWKTPKHRKPQYISVVDQAKEEKIKVHVIFESTVDNNEVIIQKPILVDLNRLNKVSYIKPVLDKVITYYESYSYINELNYSEIKGELNLTADVNKEDAKIGSIIATNKKEILPINAKFNKNSYYLAKLDFKEINKFGKIYFQYGYLKSESFEDEQIYLVFKANSINELELVIEGNDVLDYKINLKHILLIDISYLNLLREDIPYLPFI